MNTSHDLQTLIIKYMDEKRLHQLNGRNFVTSIVEAIGYRRDLHTDAIPAFLDDNPGAAEALFNWICKQNNPEWRAAVASQITLSEDDDSDEGDTDD